MGRSDTIVRRSLHNELVERLNTLIVEGKLMPGTKVPERELCERFGVSRTPMREALKVLAAEGLISLEPNRGAWVTEVTTEELEEIFPVMGALEALAGELACARISDKEIVEIRRMHDRMVAHRRNERLPEYFKENQAIHQAILRAANNSVLASEYQALAVKMRRARYLANMSVARWDKAVEEHEEIIAALEARDGLALAAILKNHLANKYETVRTWLQDNKTSATQ